VFGDFFGGHRTWRRTARRPAGPFRQTCRIGVLNASLVVSPEWAGSPLDLAPNHSIKPPFHLALVSSDFEFLFHDMYLYLVLLCFACVFQTRFRLRTVTIELRMQKISAPLRSRRGS
jgi:hypothetical protein